MFLTLMITLSSILHRAFLHLAMSLADPSTLAQRVSCLILFEAADAGVSHLRPAGCMRLRMAMNAAPHKTVNLLKPL